MRDYAILTDSGCDLTKDMVEEMDIGVAPMGLTLLDKAYRHYHDFRELSKEKFYSLIRSGNIGTTSGVNMQDVIDLMREKLQKGMDILYLSFSSGMSCSYQNACLAAEEMRDEFPDANIQVLDTKAGSVGLGMLAYLAAKKKAAGERLEQVVEYVMQQKDHICHYFMVEDLMYISKTGRISHLKATVGSMLGIKPIFILDDNGKVKDEIKVRGKKAGIKHILSKVQEKCTDASTFFICHADVENEANDLKAQVLKMYPTADVFVNCVGPILGNNTGPGALALIFCGSAR